MKSEKQKAMFSAYHEAGHHLLAWLHGCKLGKLSIQGSEDCEGVAQSYISEDRKSFHGGMLTPARALELMAGRCATEIFCPDVDVAGTYRHDFQTVKNLNCDSKIFLEMNQWRVDHPAGDIEDFYRTFKAPIVEIIQSKQGKRAIQALAKALRKAGYLSGREAARILEAAWGSPLPPLALPSDQHPSLDPYLPAKNFNDFIYQMSVFEKLFRKDIMHWINNDANTPEQDKIVEQLSGAFNFIKILVNK